MEKEILTKLKNVSEKLENFLKSYDWYGLEIKQTDREEEEVKVWKNNEVILKGKTKNTIEDLVKETEEEILEFLIDELEEYIDWESEETSIDWTTQNFGSYGNFINTYFELKIKDEFLEIFKKLAENIEKETGFYVAGNRLIFVMLTKRYASSDYEEIRTNLEKIKDWLSC